MITLAGGNSRRCSRSWTQELASARTRQRGPSSKKLGDTAGNLSEQTITMHTEFDPLVLVANETIFADRVAKQGKSQNLVQLYVAPPATYSQSTGAPYGAGHCVFSVQQRVALIDSLDSWVRRGVFPLSKASVASFGPGLDTSFSAPKWPSGATS